MFKVSIHNIYPSIVTWRSDWQRQLRDCDRLGVRTPALFLTGLGRRERKSLYDALEHSKIRTLPHVHIRDDHSEDELDYLVKRYGTKVFTIHYQHLKYFEKSKHRKKLFIENNNGTSTVKDLRRIKGFGGACIDLAHLEEFKWHDYKNYVIACQLALEYPVGINHLNAVRADRTHWHGVKKLSELDYLKGIPKEFFSKYICLEVNNAIAEQLRMQKYVGKLLGA